MECIRKFYRQSPARGCAGRALALAAAALSLSACGEPAVDEFGIPRAQTMEAPDYDFAELGPSKVPNIILDGKSYLFADETAYIASVDGVGVKIALSYVSVYGEGKVVGWGPSSFAYIPGWSSFSKADHQAVYDGASLGPGIHRVEIGEQILSGVPSYSGQDYTLSGSWSNATVTADATFEEGVAYMASTVNIGGDRISVVIRSDCGAYDSLQAETRGKCYDGGLVVGASDPLYAGLRKSEALTLSRAEIAALKKKRMDEAAGVIGEVTSDIMKDFQLFGGGGGQ